MNIYIDSDFRCHVENDGTMQSVESDFFDGKCAAIVECYRYVPAGQTWTRADGHAFEGEMIAPHKDLTAALAIQAEYDHLAENAGDYVAAYDEGVQSA